MSKKLKQTYFAETWLEDPNFKNWIAKGQDSSVAYCKLCKKSIKLSNMGVDALLSHADGIKHKANVKQHSEIQNFFCGGRKDSGRIVKSSEESCLKDSGETSAKSTPDMFLTQKKMVGKPPPQLMQATVEKSMISGDALKAEIIWTLFSVYKGFSNNSAKDLNATFCEMFPDSMVVSQFQLGPDKLKYFTNWGAAPYIRQLLLNELDSASFIAVSFDESLNKLTQTCQMDLIVRYWHEADKQVKVRYWDSKFLGHSVHQDLLSHFNQSIDKIDLNKVVQISMDGPVVNLKFFEKLVNYREEIGANGLIDIGTCGLHIIHGAFKSGFEATSWSMKDLLKGCFQILHDTPACRADYISITGSDKFPLSFCGIRWVEDQNVAERLLEVWPNIIKIVAFWKSLPKSKQPSSKTFEAVCRGVEDPLTTAKLSFFSFFASIFQPFLVKYQSKVPMLPFLYTDLSQLLRSVLTLVVKEDVLQACSSGLQLSKIDLDKQIMFKKKRCFHLGFATESILAELRKKDVVNESTIGEFLLGVQKCVVATLKKLFERCPTGSVILRNAVIFDPAILKSSTSTVLSKKLKYMLQNLVSLKIVATKEADLAFQQFGFMHDEVMGAVDINGISRLDDFYFQKLKISKYAELSAILKIILTLSHGQSDVERGFSCNTHLLEENIKDDSIVSKRLIKDHLVSNNLKPHMLEITSQIRASCRRACQRYHSYLEDQKKMQDKLSSEKAKEIIFLEIQELQEKVLILEKSIANLNQTFVSLVQEAEKSMDMPVKIAEANALKRKSEEQINEKRKIEDTIKVLQAKRRKP